MGADPHDETVGTATAPVPRGHETRDVAVCGVAAVAGGLVLLALVIHVALWFQMRGLWAARERGLPASPSIAAALPTAPPEPRLQTAPEADLRDLRREEDARLDGYGWVDRQGGVIHIPIAQAMALVAGDAR